jgi:ubiquinone/menaquinone biosynthesis C-methylase UbiE
VNPQQLVPYRKVPIADARRSAWYILALAIGLGCASRGPAAPPAEHREERQNPQKSGFVEHADSRHESSGVEYSDSEQARQDSGAQGTQSHPAHGSSGYHMDFSDVERFARHFDGPERDAWQRPEHVVQLMDLKPGHTVADLGAGTGYFVGPVARAVGKSGRVLALDVEPNMVEYIRRRAAKSGWSNVEARVVPTDDPRLAPGSVDRVLIVNTWHHIDNRPQYTKRLAAALRPKGAVYVVDFTSDSDIGPPVEHRLSAGVMVHELEAGGLYAEILKEELPKQYVVRGKLKP